MSVYHGDLKKKKRSGSRKRAFRKKRKYELGTFPAETKLDVPKRKKVRGRGGNTKHKLLRDKYVCVTTSDGITEKVEIRRVIENPANIDYNRRGIITKGVVLETSLGFARVTSRPGQHGVINAVHISRRKK